MPDDAKVFKNSNEFEGATFDTVSFAGAEFRNVNLAGVKLEGLFLDTQISGPVDGMKINGVEVAPLVEAELVRLNPELGKFKSRDLDEVRDGLRIVESQLAATWDRVLSLPESERHRQVDGEWSIVQTLRHLVFIVDLYIRRQALGMTDAYHPMGLPPSHIPPSPPGTGIDVAARPSFDEAMAVWDCRLSEVRDLLKELTQEDADATRPMEGPGFPPRTETMPKRQALRVVLRETWAHNRYMTRDLDRITAGT